jgi:dihydrofolate reductase
MKTVVCSTTLKAEDFPGVTLLRRPTDAAISALRADAGKDIWLFGGGKLFSSLLLLGAVDTVEVAVVPVLLGGGVPLLPASGQRIALDFTKQRLYPKTGIVRLEYAVRRAA